MKIHGRMEYMEGKLRAKKQIHKVRQEAPQHLSPNSILQHPFNWLLLEGSWASLACSLAQPHCSLLWQSQSGEQIKNTPEKQHQFRRLLPLASSTKLWNLPQANGRGSSGSFSCVNLQQSFFSHGMAAFNFTMFPKFFVWELLWSSDQILI